MDEAGKKCYKAVITFEIEVPCYGNNEDEAKADAEYFAENFEDVLFVRYDVDAVETVSIRIKGEEQ